MARQCPTAPEGSGNDGNYFNRSRDSTEREVLEDVRFDRVLHGTGAGGGTDAVTLFNLEAFVLVRSESPFTAYLINADITQLQYIHIYH